MPQSPLTGQFKEKPTYPTYIVFFHALHTQYFGPASSAAGWWGVNWLKKS
jgi:hypothetical protein